MLYTKILPKSFLGSGEDGLEVFLPYMSKAAILFNSAKPFDQIVSTTSSTEAPISVAAHVKSAESWHAVSKKTFKDL